MVVYEHRGDIFVLYFEKRCLTFFYNDQGDTYVTEEYSLGF